MTPVFLGDQKTGCLNPWVILKGFNPQQKTCIVAKSWCHKFTRPLLLGNWAIFQLQCNKGMRSVRFSENKIHVWCCFLLKVVIPPQKEPDCVGSEVNIYNYACIYRLYRYVHNKKGSNIAGYSRFCYVSLRQSTIHHHVTQETDGEGFTSGKSSMVYDEHWPRPSFNDFQKGQCTS